MVSQANLNLLTSEKPALAQPQLSVVIPVYNERFTVRELVRRVQAVNVSKEIVIVDDGSTDGTFEIYFNWIGAIGWFLFGKILRRRHITKVATRGYRLVSGLQQLERRIPFGFGQSTIVVGRLPAQP